MGILSAFLINAFLSQPVSLAGRQTYFGRFVWGGGNSQLNSNSSPPKNLGLGSVGVNVGAVRMRMWPETASKAGIGLQHRVLEFK